MKKLLLILLSVSFIAVAHAQWVNQNINFPWQFSGVQDIAVVSDSVVWATANDLSGLNENRIDISITMDGGLTWMPTTMGNDTNIGFCNITAVDYATAWTAMYNRRTGGSGGIWKTTDGGGTWNQQDSGVILTGQFSFPDEVYFYDANKGFIVGDPDFQSLSGYFEIYTTIDGGTTWTRVPKANIPQFIGGETALNNVFDVRDSTIWFCTSKGRVFKSTNYGYNWTASTSGASTPYCISFANDSNGLMLDEISITHLVARTTTDGGATWSLLTPTGLMYQTEARAVPGTNTYISTGAFAMGSGSSYSNDFGATWITLDTGVAHTCVRFHDNTTGWSGNYVDTSFNSGIAKYDGIPLSVHNPSTLVGKASVYPNPNTGAFNVSIMGDNAGAYKITITDMEGRPVLSKQYQPAGPYSTQRIDLSAQAKGVYLMIVENTNNRWVQRVVVQ